MNKSDRKLMKAGRWFVEVNRAGGPERSPIVVATAYRHIAELRAAQLNFFSPSGHVFNVQRGVTP